MAIQYLSGGEPGIGIERTVDDVNNPLPVASVGGPAFTASGAAPVTGAVASSTLTSGFTPKAGRTFYLELTGTGSVTGTVVYLCNDAVTYAPNVVAVDGASPSILDSIAYNGGTQNGVRMGLQVDQAGMTVKFSPGTVTGTVNYAFVQ